MNRILLFLLPLGLWILGSLGVTGAERRNVLFLIADDLNCYLGCYGHPLAKTPNIDKLAARGTLFERAYCQYPVCNASRASIFSGLRPDQTRVWENWTHFRHTTSQVKTMPEWFKEHGYHAIRVGKIYHYNVPKEIGMDCQDDPASWTMRANPYGRDKIEEEQITTLKPGAYGGTLSWMAQDGRDEEQTDGIGATAAINALAKFGKDEKPLFLAFGMYRPHTPYVAPKKYFEMYPLDQIHPVSGAEEDWKDVPTAALLSLHKEEKNLDVATKKTVIQAYLASITFMDAQVGRVLDYLEESGLAKNTLVVMTSDHGYHMSEHGLWQKQSLFEEATRVPLIVATPDQKAKGGTSKEPVELIDLYPTLCAWAGLKMPKEKDLTRDGQSLLPILDDATAPSKGYAISQAFRTGASGKAKYLFKSTIKKNTFHGYSIRTGTHRYNRWDEGKLGEELYYHSEDPRELNNLADHEDHAEMKRELAAKLAPFEKAHSLPVPPGRTALFKPIKKAESK